MKGKHFFLSFILIMFMTISCSASPQKNEITQKNKTTENQKENSVQKQKDAKSSDITSADLNKKSIKTAQNTEQKRDVLSLLEETDKSQESKSSSQESKESSRDSGDSSRDGQSDNTEKEVTADGKAAISSVSGDKLKAEENAKTDALRNAVEQGVGVLVSSSTITENFKLLSDNIYAKASGYVKKYTIIKTREEDGIIIVTVRAVVKIGEIEDSLVALSILKFPTIMVVGEEKYGDKVLENFIIGSVLNEKMLAARFLLVDRDQMEALKERDVEGALNDMNVASALARRFSADIIVTYKAGVTDGGSSAYSGTNTDMYKASSRVAVKVIDASSARLICAENASEKGTSFDGSENAANRSLEIAAAKLYKPLIKKIKDSWKEKAFGGGQWIEIKISDVNFKLQQKIITFLRNTKGITSVKDPQMDNGVMIFAVQGALTGMDVADKLSNIEGVNIEVTGYSQNSVQGKCAK